MYHRHHPPHLHHHQPLLNKQVNLEQILSNNKGLAKYPLWERGLASTNTEHHRQMEATVVLLCLGVVCVV